MRGAGLPVNRQRRQDFFSALHVACLRNFVRVAVRLIALGADVNSVGRESVMPLHCADKGTNTSPTGPPSLLHTVLLKKGARRTWRRDPPPAPDAAAPDAAAAGVARGGSQLTLESARLDPHGFTFGTE